MKSLKAIYLIGIITLISSCAGPEPQRGGLRRSQPRYSTDVEAGDIRMGMNRDHVFNAWGQPQDRLFAGDESHGNEKWIYREGPSQLGNYTQSRIVYFERGRVIGWETQ